MSLLRTAGRVAVASSVHGRIQRRQRERWAAADQAAVAQPAPTPPTPPAAVDDVLARLERLGKLRESGVLTEAEFSAQKARLLG
jgi:hypothetical protein